MFPQLTIKSYAKINLSLRVLDKRPDGYHNIDSIFQSVSLHDDITITLLDKPGVEVICDHPDVPAGNRNIVYKIIQALPKAKQGVRIEIKKQIPVGAGLGGGSSNAAAVLFGLNQLWGLGLSLEQLMTIGAGVGADVPFCLVGGTARVTGIGEVVKKIGPVIPGKYIIIVKPLFAVSTAWAYGEFDKSQIPNPKTCPEETEGSKQCMFYNELEPVVIAGYPQIAKIKQQLLDLGAEGAAMSGSGSAVFGVFDGTSGSNVPKGKDAHPHLLERQNELSCFGQVFIVSPVNNGAEIV
jgi:4-diphosphocytidyl-2-C-methyl-D-erythritol kinase